MEETYIYRDSKELQEALAGHLCQWVLDGPGDGGYSIALSGGSTPRGFYALLAQPPWRERLDWPQLRFFFGDERAVAPEHKDSNLKMVREALLEHVPLTGGQVFPMQAWREDLDQAAREYEGFINLHVNRVGDLPAFDLILLGMGDDGHTASLFPGTSALEENQRLVVPVHVPRLDSWRMTMTLPLINNARRVVVMVTGKAKAPVLAEVFADRFGHRYPIQRVTGAGEMIWLLDEAAAEGLNH